MIRQGAGRGERQTPVVLPQVEVTVSEAGTVGILVDGVARTPAATISKEDARAECAAIAAELDSPIQVRVRDADGATYTDILTADDAAPPARARDDLDAGRDAQQAEASAATVSLSGGGLVGLAGEGFVPGEEVAFAVIVSRQRADDDGTAALRVPATLAARSAGPFVLLAQMSGRFAVAGSFESAQR